MNDYKEARVNAGNPVRGSQVAVQVTNNGGLNQGQSRQERAVDGFGTYFGGRIDMIC